MSRYIDADELIKIGLQDGAYEYISVREIAEFPTADVKPVVRGEWVPREEKNLWECSVCGNIIYSEDAVDKKVYHAFCGKCGADMRGDIT